jgi:hypothetical protein
MSTDQIEDMQFTCPQCGSHHFGSGIDPPVSTPLSQADLDRMEGMCHGYVPSEQRLPNGAPGQRACGFRWWRKDDAKYFRGLGTFRPRTMAGQSP